MKKILFIFGTRPEAIKMAPLIKAFKKYPDEFNVKVCVTAQHREMLDQVLTFFNIKPDYDLDLMKQNQTLFDITVNCLKDLQNVFTDFEPDNVFVQGDTTTTFIGALCSFYFKTTISHLEAGLRSGKKYSPFPEEGNRKLTGHIADFHFPPTEASRLALEKEGIRENVWVVGNTVIDALMLGLEILESDEDFIKKETFEFLDLNKKIVLITGHRRESFGKPFEDFASAIRDVALEHSDIQFVYPVHLNPNVREPVNKILSTTQNVHLIEPLDYPNLIWLMNQSHVVVTDSGGIQEEAPSLGKPVLVTREVTERMEGVEANTAKLVGTDRDRVTTELNKLLTDKDAYNKMAKSINPYGDGTTSEQIVNIFRTKKLL